MSSYPWAAGYIDDGDRPKVVTSRFQYDDSYTLERYHATGGYDGLRAALAKSPSEVHDDVRGATVLGRATSSSTVTRASPVPTRIAS
jgi:NADH-quinone oxidoreductase subunit F